MVFLYLSFFLRFQGQDFKMRYTSERVLEESLSMKDVLLPGLNIALNSDFTPDSGKLNIGLTSTFRCPCQLIYRRVIQSVSVY